MTTEQMRKSLLDRYPLSESWARKVRKMSDAQVFAVYIRFQNKELFACQVHVASLVRWDG